MFLFGQEPTDEQLAEMQERELKSEAFQHDVLEWVQSHDEHGMRILKSLIWPYSDQPAAAYMVAVINLTLDRKFGICHVCGKKHADLDPSVLLDPHGKMKDIPEYVSPDRGTGIPPEIVWAQMSGEELLVSVPSSIQDQMDEYEVDFIEYQWPKVRCHNCGNEYQSLDDRMRREPGIKGCNNCQQKAKWG